MPKKKPAPKPKKSATKSASTLPMPTLIPQPNGKGALLSGGIPGLPSNGGRPPDEFKRWLAHLASRSRTIAAMSKILKDPNHQHFEKVREHVTARGYPELEPQLIAANVRASAANVPTPAGGLTINFNFIAEGRRYAEPAEVVIKPNGSKSNGHN